MGIRVSVLESLVTADGAFIIIEMFFGVIL